MAASGAKYGIATSHFYWIGAIPAMIFVGIFMMPFYCAVAIVDPQNVAGFIDMVSQRYTVETGLTPEAYLCRAAAGAHIEPLNESMHA